ncbi:aldo/keto reductase [Flavobacterium pallidum]|uniref:Aldo/keto reductase n=1 Tax=Flavobacterium pallidum TaxID=2172098 RepID=A0A2S1SDK4_9FLAO|nr:aldo/keto reductase [Flavobacterium pallidum]AWI24463.1 aldo/keto reductase [Flavobacterium pallidum]
MRLNNKIGLGTVQFGIPYGVTNSNGQTPADEVSRILRYASANGIDTLDTASAYGNAEETLGQNDLNRFKIVSKFLSAENYMPISAQFTKSLQNLKMNSLYGYLAHRPLALLDNEKEWETLLGLKQQGKVQKIGFSLNSVNELERLLDKGCFPDLIQVPFNYFDNRFAPLMQELKSKGCEIHTRSAFLQGLFFADTTKLPAFFDGVKEQINALQNDFGTNLSGALLKYTLSLPYIDKVIMGVENLEQLQNNITGIDSALLMPENKNIISDTLLMPSNWPK